MLLSLKLAIQQAFVQTRNGTSVQTLNNTNCESPGSPQHQTRPKTGQHRKRELQLCVRARAYLRNSSHSAFQRRPRKSPVLAVIEPTDTDMSARFSATQCGRFWHHDKNKKCMDPPTCVKTTLLPPNSLMISKSPNPQLRQPSQSHVQLYFVCPTHLEAKQSITR